MTKYILHGGRTTIDSPDNDLFFTYFTQFVEKDEVDILLCLFAREKEKWDTRLEIIRDNVKKQTTKKVIFSVAENPKDLLTKLGTHDVLYVDGGEPELIEPLLPQLTTLKEKLNGKVYIGSSMGAFIVSSNYILSFNQQESETVHHGLGLLPISTLCHWDVETKKEIKIEALKKEISNLPILTIGEGKCTMFLF
jgi:peptidase E